MECGYDYLTFIVPLRRLPSSASGISESRSALLILSRVYSRKKKTIKVNTRHKLTVRVSGITAMVINIKREI